MSPIPDPESLLEHDSFVRGLARAMLTDEAAVDDAVQQTWLGVLRAQTPPRALHSWLATLVRNAARDALRRGETRARFERQGGREEAVPSMQTILEREEARREVVAALAALPELYRDALLLKYFEDLTPRAIAQRLEIPAETARTRVKRGLELLRAELARRRGGVGPAALALLPLAGWHLSLPSTALTGVVTVLTAQTKVAMGLAGLLLLSLGLWWVMDAIRLAEVQLLTSKDSASAVAVSPAEPISKPAVAASAPATHLTREAALTPSASAAAGDARFGSLLVRVVWHDNAPAVGVGISWFPITDRNGRVYARHFTTDGEGCFHVVKAPVGKVWIWLDRSWGGIADIAPAKETELRLQIRQGTDVRGKVVNGRGEPVDGAEIHLWEDPQGDECVAARSDVKGEFLVRQMDCTRFWAFATKPGYATSVAKQPNVTIGAMVNLTFELSKPGVELRGRVRSVDGVPIEGAAVVPVNRADRFQSIPTTDGSLAGPAPAPRTETDVKGEFVAQSLTPGKLPLVVRAAGFAMWKEEVNIDAVPSNPLDIVLEKEVVLEGAVKDGDGAPARRASVSVGDLGQPDYFDAQPSEVDGSFRMGGLPKGEFTVNVTVPDLGTASASFQGEPGQVLRWDVILRGVNVLRGRVVDEKGNPCAGFYVHAGRHIHDRTSIDRTSPPQGGMVRTNAKGEFKIVNCPPELMSVYVQVPSGGATVKYLNDVRLSDGPLTIILSVDLDETAIVKGVVKDTLGNPLPAARVRVDQVSHGGGYGDFAVKPDGSFESPKHLAGSFRVRVNVPGFGHWNSPVRRVNTGEVWDLGTIQIPKAGTLVVVLHPQKGLTNDKYQIALKADDEESFERLHYEFPGNVSPPQSLSPGHYSLSFQCMAVNPVLSINRINFDIRSGEETRLDVDLRAAAHRFIMFTLPKGTPPLEGEKETLKFTVKGESGDVEYTSTVTYRDEQAMFYAHWVYLPGKHRFEALTSRGLKASGEFTVDAPSSKVETMTIVLSH